MSKTITLTEHRPSDGLLTMRVRNTTYNVNIFFNPNAKSTLDTQMRKIIQKEAKAGNFWIYSSILIFYLDKRQPKGSIGVECGEALLKHGYKLKFFNSINFSKSMKYNPMAYIHSEKDILKLVTALMTNTKGEGQGAVSYTHLRAHETS